MHDARTLSLFDKTIFTACLRFFFKSSSVRIGCKTKTPTVVTFELISRLLNRLLCYWAIAIAKKLPNRSPTTGIRSIWLGPVFGSTDWRSSRCELDRLPAR